METGKYPAWRHHASEKPRLVHNEVEEAALGPGWADTPAAFAGNAPAKPLAAPRPTAETTGEMATSSAQATPTEPVSPVEIPTQSDEVESMYSAPASAVIDMVAGADKATLERLKAIELNHPKYPGGRKGVLTAIDEALAALATVE